MKTASKILHEVFHKYGKIDSRALLAMDEYGRQEAIEFARWLMTNQQYSVGLNAGGFPYGKMDGSFEYFTVEELYKIWKDERAKNM